MHTDLHAPILEWQAPSRIAHDRSQRWYLCASLAVLAMIAYGILTSAWSFSVTIAILAGLFYLIRNEPHPQHTIRIASVGIQFDGAMHAWDEWKDFWMLASPDHCELHVESKKFYRPDLIIHTGPMDPLVVRDTLIQHLPQNPAKREKLLDLIIRFCKL